MASTSTQRASSYEVFLSFFGKDTRNSFTDHLYVALKDRCIEVFRDNEELERGKELSELLKAIQESTYAIVVISANYASSRWCLKELAEIVHCMKGTGRILPIFYHVDPSDVRNLTGTFAEAFARHEKDPKVDIQMMKKWRAAFKKVGYMAGWHLHDGPESIVVKEIGSRILNGLSRNLSVSKDFVGIESRVEEIMTLLSIESDDVRFLGIYGMGGVGKTTLSRVIDEIVSPQFEVSCFISNIREETRTGQGLLYLQKQLISKIIKASEINISDEHEAIKVIANRLRNKKVFIVLDDVDEVKQIEALAESHDWFGQGSRIIITSRDRHLLDIFVNNNTFEVKVLNDAEALRLFSLKAFKENHPKENFEKLSQEIVNYAHGLPLALKVFGSFLFGRTLDKWESARDRLKENPNAEILDKLKISFDGLENSEKKLFLDIACFFNGAYIDNSIFTDKLTSLGYHPKIDIDVLNDKSLITTSREGRLQMHDLLQKLGQKIVRCESIEEPGQCSRLWHYEDVLHVLKNNTGTDAVRGIVLQLLPSQKQELLNVEAFSTMKKLKWLEIRHLGNYNWHGDPSNFMLSNELCSICLPRYPFESLPTNFQPNNLVELILWDSKIKQLWDGSKSFFKLKRIDLSYSLSMIETPDLSEVPNLEELILKSCKRLSKVHPSIEFLRRLKRLDLQCCERLERLPDSVGQLSHLRKLYLSNCSWLQVLPKLPLKLEELDVANCPSLEKFYNEMDMWTSNEKLRSIRCKSMADYIDYDGKHSTILNQLPRSPMWGRYVASLLCGTNAVCGPALLGSGIPEWFKDKSTTDLDYDSDELKGFALFIVYQVYELDIYPKNRREVKDHEHGSSNSRIFDGSNLNFPHFLFQFQDNGDDFGEPLVLCVPGEHSVGPSGLWVYIPAKWYYRKPWLKVSITTGSQNVEVKECVTRVVRRHDVSEFFQVLNSISPHDLDLQSYENFVLDSDDCKILLVYC